MIGKIGRPSGVALAPRLTCMILDLLDLAESFAVVRIAKVLIQSNPWRRSLPHWWLSAPDAGNLSKPISSRVVLVLALLSH